MGYLMKYGIMWILSFLIVMLLACGGNLNSSANVESTDSLDASEVLIDTLQPPPPLIPSRYLMGKFDPSKDTNFVRIANQYAAGSGVNGYMRKEAYTDFVRMHKAAAEAGISLIIKSPTRNFWRQKSIWEGKWTGQRKVGGANLARTMPDPVKRAQTILLYSSMPGTSRHHWGTDIDLNAFENSYFGSGKGLKEYQWLTTHAADFGFCQPYTDKSGGRTGYEEEKWHWSYMPLARQYLTSYQATITLDSISGFQGSEAAAPLNVIVNYVAGIDSNCQ